MRALFILLCLSITSFGQTTKIYIIGDSTMADKPNPEENPERGWGQMLPLFFTEDVQIENHAVNGRSTRSFRDLGHWKAVHDILKPGDYVFIQFGHNDGKITDPTRYTNPHSSYRHNLIRYVEETKEKGGIPILFTSIARRKFNENGVLVDSHGAYTLETRLVAQKLNISWVDMQYYTELLEESYGLEKSRDLHLQYKKGEHPYYPEGIDDNTHLSVLGATEIAKIAAEQIQQLKLPLSEKVNLK